MIEKLSSYCFKNHISHYVMVDYHEYALEMNLQQIDIDSHLDYDKTLHALNHFLHLETLRFKTIKLLDKNIHYVFLDRSFLTLLSHLKAISHLGFLSLDKFSSLEKIILEFTSLVEFNKLVVLDVPQNILEQRDPNNEYGIFSNKRYNQEFSEAVLTYKNRFKTIIDFKVLKNNSVSPNLFKEILTF
ncbi:MAG: hypothetical protein ACK5M1_04745 [Xanthomarina gelatinilytica]|uniref:hypothetical protein n=1 Tax=Xanthomarina gelatinilytica TaxID=1137281 RepID=UPI003A8675B7